MHQVFYRTNRQQLTARQIINLTIFLTRIKLQHWISKCHRIIKRKIRTKCTQVDFTCKLYKQAKISKRIIAFNFLTLQVLKVHQVVNRMQNRHGIILKVLIIQTCMVMLKIKTGICNYSNKTNKKIQLD